MFDRRKGTITFYAGLLPRRERIIYTSYYIKEISGITGVKAGTIRFYEKCGFLEPVERMSNQYRIFNEHHVYQVRICSLVFGGFVNKRLRKISVAVIKAAKTWDLDAYDRATHDYRQAIIHDIIRTTKAIAIVSGQNDSGENDKTEYSKREAAELIGVTPETIRNWERNRLLAQQPQYSHRIYRADEIGQMYVIRFLLDTGYSCMAILRFLTQYSMGEKQKAADFLLGTLDDEELRSRSDRYLKSLERAKTQADELCSFLIEMKKI